MNCVAMNSTARIFTTFNHFLVRPRFTPQSRGLRVARPWPTFRAPRIVCMAESYLITKLESAEKTWKELSAWFVHKVTGAIDGGKVDETSQRRLNQETSGSELEQQQCSRLRPTLFVLPSPAILVGRVIPELQNEEIGLEKAAAKGSKAEQRAKKKQVEEEISQLSAKLKENHVEELASLAYSNGNDKSNIDNLVKAIAGVSVIPQQDHPKPSKGAKRREKRAQQEAAKEQRIQEEQSNIVSDRMIEDEKLERKLEPLGLTINEIKPDGHCLYRAVEDQLALLSGGSSPCTYQELGEMATAYTRKHAYDFLPFFLSEYHRWRF